MSIHTDSPPPPWVGETLGAGAITSDITREFRGPEVVTGRWGCRISAPLVAVPEASVHKDRGPVLWKHDVRPAWQTPVVKPEAIAGAVQHRAKLHLRGRVPPLDARHVPASTGRADRVGHHQSPFIESRTSAMTSAIWVAR